MNKSIVLGRLGQDPETRFTQSGEPICRFTLATTQKWKDKAGQPREETEWHRVVLFGRQAEVAQQYLAKGRQALIEGRLKTREWTGQDNVKRYTTEIVADHLELVGSRPDANGQTYAPQAQATAPRPAAPQAQATAPAPATSHDSPPADYDDSDIPF